jgi:hypothetical protein
MVVTGGLKENDGYRERRGQCLGAYGSEARVVAGHECWDGKLLEHEQPCGVTAVHGHVGKWQ